MVNYYQILGLPNFAAPGEVKNAFRRLAKLYHPDVNPLGQEHFKSVVKAYEVLSDHYAKSQYDYRLKTFLNSAHRNLNSPKKETKTYDFTEAELKRRQYYQEHYKKQYEQAQNKPPVEELKKAGNEFKNIIIATPIAVFLIMLVLNVWNSKPQMQVETYKEVPAVPVGTTDVVRKRISTGDTPYAEYFGGAKRDTVSKSIMKFKNMCGNDLILFLFHQNKFVRSCYVEHGFEVRLEMLPKEISLLRIMQGKNFEYVKELSKAGVFGAFEDGCRFFEYRKKLKLNSNNILTVTDFVKEGFKEIEEDNFFKKDS